ncbi:unnamed protein product [Cuscuta campestris]|uniref:Transmembrane protein n=1 Tax=Cuscuta campestris TaxID=132261 RepID=A0A484LRJ2_9ASTE|nr:unnamed protein product [Cuscuta campestris]
MKLLIAGLSSPATYSGPIFANPSIPPSSYSIHSSSSSSSFLRQLSSSRPSLFTASISRSKPSPTALGVEVKASSHQHSSNAGVSPMSEDDSVNAQVGSPRVSPTFISIPKLTLSDRAFFLLSFIAVTTSMAFTSLAFAAVPTLFAMRRAAISLSKLADTARDELPSTMAVLRLSGMEISDLSLELTDLSKEISDGVTKSAQAVQAAEAGVRRLGSLARQQTMSMIEERANLPAISMKPVVARAAKKTSQAVGQASKALMNMISRGDSDDDSIKDEED